MIFPGLQILLRALHKPEAGDLSSRFLPLDVNYPALSRWVARWKRCRATTARIRRTGAFSGNRVVDW